MVKWKSRLQICGIFLISQKTGPDISCELSPWIISLGDNSSEMSNPIFWEKEEKYV